VAETLREHDRMVAERGASGACASDVPGSWLTYNDPPARASAS